jgi:hypothetical protein
MEKIDTKTSRSRFKLNPKFYSKECVITTLKTFKELCDGEYNEKTHEITLTPKQECDIKELSLEFCNYCLGSMKN